MFFLNEISLVNNLFFFFKEQPNGSEETVGSFSSGPASTDYSTRPGLARGSSLSEHGEWSKQFIEMDLPSFRPTYLFIVRIQLDVIHECLKLRKDQRPIGDPSFLSIRQVSKLYRLNKGTIYLRINAKM